MWRLVQGRIPADRMNWRLLLSSCLLSVALVTAETPFWTPVNWENPEGVLMKGRYHPATEGHWTWVFLHGLGSNSAEWDGFAKTMARQGLGVFVFDAPGHGKSQRLASGDFYEYKTFSVHQWARFPAAYGNAVDVLQKKFKLDRSRIGAAGASLGANVALVFAANDPQIPAALLLSPGMEYAGINIDQSSRRYGSRVLAMVASPGDVYAAQTVRALALRRNDPALKLMEGTGSAHGASMLDDAMSARLIDWMLSLEKK